VEEVKEGKRRARKAARETPRCGAISPLLAKIDSNSLFGTLRCGAPTWFGCLLLLAGLPRLSMDILSY